ncbi:MAG: hypothetical protein HKO67_13985 [Flavobacteriaceae bacterium]|nr:hypothetical protein [Flavobacteriaceae bacterium]
MKTLIILLLLSIFTFFSCKQEATDKTDQIEEVTEMDPSIKGVWELVSFYNYDEEGNVTDTLMANETNKQVKIYTETRIMWSRFNISDTIDWFGYGAYETTDTSLVETLEYGSKSMNRVIEEEQNVFDFKLVLSEDTYSQITIDEDGDPFFAENYRRIER